MWYKKHIEPKLGLHQESRFMHRQDSPEHIENNWRSSPSWAARTLEYAWCAGRIKAGSTILDVGTGNSNFCAELVTKKQCKVTCVEPGRCRAHAKYRKIANYRLVKEMIENWKSDDKFDHIACISVIEHVKNEQPMLEAMSSRLNDGGTLLFTMPYSHVNGWTDDRHSNGQQKYYSIADVYERIIIPSRLKLVDMAFIHYKWPKGAPRFCAPNEAGVICLSLSDLAA